MHRFAREAAEGVPAPQTGRSDEPLLRQSIDTPELFATFYRQQSEGVLRFFARRTFDPEVAVDLTAETFAQAYASRKRFRGRTEQEAGGWLYAIARRQLAAYLRKGRLDLKAVQKLGIERPQLADEEVERIEELADLAELRAAAAAGLSTLPPGLREAVSLRVIDELAYPEVARHLGVAEQTARMRVSRGLRTLRARLAALQEGSSGR